jgi:hypothetical protein
VRLGEAVLVGRAGEPVARLSNGDGPIADDADKNAYTWYRIVLPVAH